MREYILGAMCACMAVISFNASAAVIHTYEFGNIANGGIDSGALTFSSEGTPVTGGFIESDFGDFKATINGNYYDFTDLQPLGGGWTPIVTRYLYDFTNSQVRVLVSLEKDTQIFKYNVILSYFGEPTGFGVGQVWFRSGITSFPKTDVEDYETQVGYLHTTSPVPIPSAVWLFGSGLMGLIGLARRKVIHHYLGVINV